VDLWKTLRKPEKERKRRKKSLWKEKERKGKTWEVVHRGKILSFLSTACPLSIHTFLWINRS